MEEAAECHGRRVDRRRWIIAPVGVCQRVARQGRVRATPNDKA
jgi:hypothetical protein